MTLNAVLLAWYHGIIEMKTVYSNAKFLNIKHYTEARQNNMETHMLTCMYVYAHVSGNVFLHVECTCVITLLLLLYAKQQHQKWVDEQPVTHNVEPIELILLSDFFIEKLS